MFFITNKRSFEKKLGNPTLIRFLNHLPEMGILHQVDKLVDKKEVTYWHSVKQRLEFFVFRTMKTQKKLVTGAINLRIRTARQIEREG